MKVTALTLQQRDPNRVNVMVDGKFRFSLDVFQLTELGVKTGNEYTDEQLVELETESQFGKLYGRALEYCLMRPHSSKEVKDYLYRKTLNKKVRNRRTGEVKERAGVSKFVTERVHVRLTEKGYVDDTKFARWWIENRNLRKGVSRRKLQAELTAKGVDRSIVDSLLAESLRSDADELKKMIAKRQSKYSDEQKLIAYLARQGFSYDDIKNALGDT
jgi:regulatory protein